MGLQTGLRNGAVDLFEGYKNSIGLKLQVYPGRPLTLHVPSAFVDSMSERITYDGLRQRFASASCIVLHGRFDSKDTAAQRDAFCDGFLDWVSGNVHAAGANSVMGNVSMEDNPNYIPDWVRQEEQIPYYATFVTLEAYGE